MRIVFFGTPDFVLPVAQSVANHFDLVGVVTTPDVPTGRKKILTPTPIKSWYMDYVLKNNKEGVILTPENLTEDTAIKLRKLHPDLFVTAAYGKLIPKKILSIPALGSINIHPSGLPKYRGPSPIQTALLNNDQTLGITIMKMDEELDHGAIYSQWEIPVTETDSFASLHVKAFTSASDKLPEVIKKIEQGSLEATEQDHSQATFTQKITKQDGFIDLSNIETLSQLEIKNLKLEIDRKVRAFYPWPTAWTKVDIKGEEKIVKLMPEGYVQLEGKTKVKVKELINGHPELKELLLKLLG